MVNGLVVMAEENVQNLGGNCSPTVLCRMYQSEFLYAYGIPNSLFIVKYPLGFLNLNTAILNKFMWDKPITGMKHFPSTVFLIKYCYARKSCLCMWTCFWFSEPLL